MNWIIIRCFLPTPTPTPCQPFSHVHQWLVGGLFPYPPHRNWSQCNQERGRIKEEFLFFLSPDWSFCLWDRACLPSSHSSMPLGWQDGGSLIDRKKLSNGQWLPQTWHRHKKESVSSSFWWIQALIIHQAGYTFDNNFRAALEFHNENDFWGGEFVSVYSYWEPRNNVFLWIHLLIDALFGGVFLVCSLGCTK